MAVATGLVEGNCTLIGRRKEGLPGSAQGNVGVGVETADKEEAATGIDKEHTAGPGVAVVQLVEDGEHVMDPAHVLEPDGLVDGVRHRHRRGRPFEDASRADARRRCRRKS
ncbi:MAG: hypothetical protein WAV28_04785 [Sedimentisphaerales bacterium]